MTHITIMGNKPSEIAPLKENELRVFASSTNFTHEQIQLIYQHFIRISAARKDDGVVDYDEFLQLTRKEDNLLSRSIFDSIDSNSDKVINFKEFVTFLSVFKSGWPEEKKQYAFKIFCDEDGKTISKKRMTALTKEILVGNANESYFVLDDQEVKELLDSTFCSYADENVITFDEFSKMVDNNPFFLKWLEIEIPETVQKKNSKRCFVCSSYK